jgi:hypothetical protein
VLYGVRGAVWRVYAFLVVAFGDRQAAVLLQIVIRMTCELYKNIDIVAAHKLLNDLFLDELVTGGKRREQVHGGQKRLSSVTKLCPRLWRGGAYSSRQCRRVVKLIGRNWSCLVELCRVLAGAGRRTRVLRQDVMVVRVDTVIVDKVSSSNARQNTRTSFNEENEQGLGEIKVSPTHYFLLFHPYFLELIY